MSRSKTNTHHTCRAARSAWYAGERARALTLFQRALDGRPGIALDHFLYGEALRNAKNGGAADEYETALKLTEGKPAREDKRVKLLYLTKSGAALLRNIMPSVDRAQVRMLQPLKPADRKTLMALLSQLVDLNNEASRVPLRAEDALEHLGKSG